MSSTEEKILEWFEKLNEFCRDKSYELSTNWKNIVSAIIKKNGCCPCRLGSVACPCEYHEQEILENGKCHCGLFIKKEKS